MTHRERIGWFLALQRIVKLSKRHVAPALPGLKRHPRLLEGETSGSTPVIIRQSMSFVHHARLLNPMQTAILHHKNNFWTQQSNGGAVKYASSTPLELGKKGHATPNTQKLITMPDRRLLAAHTIGQDLRRDQAGIKQLTDRPKLSSPGRTGSANLTKKSFAPGQAYGPPPLYSNDESREATLSASHEQVKSSFDSQGTKMDRRILEGPFPTNSNTMQEMQEKDTVADQDQPAPNSNASASTLHLDGMSLGRWAVQHLERVLSKPPSGITGVDPRATVPRSRVAPF